MNFKSKIHLSKYILRVYLTLITSKPTFEHLRLGWDQFGHFICLCPDINLEIKPTYGFDQFNSNFTYNSEEIKLHNRRVHEKRSLGLTIEITISILNSRKQTKWPQIYKKLRTITTLYSFSLTHANSPKYVKLVYQ